MRHILTLAGREIRDGLRNRWVLAITMLMAALALTLSFLGSAPTGNVGVGPVEVTIVSLASLTIFLLPLIALLLSFDALVGEFERGTMMLLLTYPVSRLQSSSASFWVMSQSWPLPLCSATGPQASPWRRRGTAMDSPFGGRSLP